MALEFARPDTRQSQIEKPHFETETSGLNWDFYILIIPNKCSKNLFGTKDFLS